MHFTYAIQKGLNVFMEKPITVDGPTSRKMLALAEEAKAKNLKVGVGLMCRHCEARQELFDRIKNGEIGDIILLRAYRLTGPVGSAFSEPKPTDVSELLYQIQRFHGFLWASGGCYSDFLIHNIDECCWMKDAWPVQAQALGGRHYRGDYIDQNFDTLLRRVHLRRRHQAVPRRPQHPRLPRGVRQLRPRHQGLGGHLHLVAHARPSAASTRARTSPGTDLVWAFPQPEPNPYQLEWDDLIDAIRKDKPYNEVKRGAEASLVTSMGRMAAHTGQVVTFDDMLNCAHEFAPDVDKLALDGPAPLQAGPDGKYPVPQPGITTRQEYASS